VQIVICDDESVYLNSIHQMIDLWASKSGHEKCVFVKEFHSSEDLLDAWENGLSVDLLFLDIQIPGELSGMEIAKRIHSRDEYIPLVFVTNYSEYVFEGYSVHALRYLQKPISQKDIELCLDIVWRQWSNGHDQFLSLSTASQSIRVPIQAIIYAEARSHTLYIFTSDEIGTYEIRSTLTELEKKLPENSFLRCHKSFMISMRHIRKYRNRIITLSTGVEIPVGRKYIPSFSAKFRGYYQGDNC